MGENTSRFLVAGIGNIFLGDDGFGPEVMRHVPARLAGPGVTLRDYGIRGMHLAYDLLDNWDALIIIDALPCRGSPGRLHVFEADRENVDTKAGLDAHAMDPAAVFAGLNALGGTAPYTIVIGCEISSVAHGMGLSDAVARTVPDAVDAIESALSRLSRSPAPAEG